jgi:hypothetical protein
MSVAVVYGVVVVPTVFVVGFHVLEGMIIVVPNITLNPF